MSDDDFAGLQAAVTEASEALRRLRKERDTLRRRVAELETQADTGDRRRRAHRERDERLQALEQEREALRGRLQALHERLSEIVAPQDTEAGANAHDDR